MTSLESRMRNGIELDYNNVDPICYKKVFHFRKPKSKLNKNLIFVLILNNLTLNQVKYYQQ